MNEEKENKETLHKKDVDSKKEKELIEEQKRKLKDEGQVFLNTFNDNIPQSMSGIGSFIRKDETSDTWFFADSADELVLNYALIAKQIAEYLDMNIFELLVNVQTRLAGVYEDEYKEFIGEISAIDKELNKRSKKL